jgi:hypothetical protein
LSTDLSIYKHDNILKKREERMKLEAQQNRSLERKHRAN